MSPSFRSVTRPSGETAAPRPRLLMIGNFLSASGVRSVTETLAERLETCGWRVMTTSRRPGRVARLADMLLRIWAERRRFTVAVVDVYSGLAFVWAVAACALLRALGKPFVLTLHGGNLPALARRRPRVIRHLLTRAVRVTAPSDYLLQAMKPYRSDLLLIPNPIDTSRSLARLRESARPRLIWVRSFHLIYDPLLALDVLARLTPEFPAVTLTMLGSDRGDGTMPLVREHAKALGIADRLELPGYVSANEVPRFLARADVFLNTSTIDNTPVSLLEAMASGLCVVSTNVGGIPHLVEHERHALLVPPRDAAAMAAAVRRILVDPALAARLSTNGRAKAAMLDWSIVLPVWDDLLRDAAGHPSNPPPDAAAAHVAGYTPAGASASRGHGVSRHV